MGLIDTDKLMQNIRNTITEQSSTLDWLNLINQQPTAYDVGAVVKKLKKESYQEFCDSERIVNLKDAIEIVKGGDK